MTDVKPDGELARLPPPARPLPPKTHILGAAEKIPADVSASGLEQHEKTCRNCGAVRITIIGEVPSRSRAWRREAAGPQITTAIEPPCGLEGDWLA